jgi:hypothetical protein
MNTINKEKFDLIAQLNPNNAINLSPINQTAANIAKNTKAPKAYNDTELDFGGKIYLSKGLGFANYKNKATTLPQVAQELYINTYAASLLYTKSNFLSDFNKAILEGNKTIYLVGSNPITNDLTGINVTTETLPDISDSALKELKLNKIKVGYLTRLTEETAEDAFNKDLTDTLEDISTSLGRAKIESAIFNATAASQGFSGLIECATNHTSSTNSNHSVTEGLEVLLAAASELDKEAHGSLVAYVSDRDLVKMIKATTDQVTISAVDKLFSKIIPVPYLVGNEFAVVCNPEGFVFGSTDKAKVTSIIEATTDMVKTSTTTYIDFQQVTPADIHAVKISYAA